MCWSPNYCSIRDFVYARQTHNFNHRGALCGGSFLLKCPGSEMFLIDAEQLFCLIKDGFIVYPELAVEDIQDKSKSEGMAM